MWGDEVARRVSEKHGLEVRFEIDTESIYLNLSAFFYGTGS
jgi:hypothetical protein